MPSRMIVCNQCGEQRTRMMYHDIDTDLSWRCNYCIEGVAPPLTKKQRRVGQQKQVKGKKK